MRPCLHLLREANVVRASAVGGIAAHVLPRRCLTSSSLACRLTPLHRWPRAQSSLALGGREAAQRAILSDLSTIPVATSVVNESPRALGWWLVATSASVFAMVVVGGITRLTRSGLSMTDWRPQGKRWPRDDTEWEAEFSQYKQFPEYQRLYRDTGFDLADFKNIFFWEWAHRMFGRSIGLIYGVPLAYFAVRGRIPRALAPTLAGLLLLGGSQGLVGWWMVKSGLEAKHVDEIEGGIPRVSPYRLAAHLTCAFTIYSIGLFTGIGILQPRADWSIAALRPLQHRVRLLALLVGLTAISGAFVAGMQAGYSFNTFPLMEGRFIPEGYMELRPMYRNFFESVPSVQLHHRALAVTTLASVTALWLSVQRMPLPQQLRFATDALLVAAWSQVGLGIATLVNAVPISLGSAHQAGALTLFSVVLFTLHSCRVPHAGKMLARVAAKA